MSRLPPNNSMQRTVLRAAADAWPFGISLPMGMFQKDR